MAKVGFKTKAVQEQDRLDSLPMRLQKFVDNAPDIDGTATREELKAILAYKAKAMATKLIDAYFDKKYLPFVTGLERDKWLTKELRLIRLVYIEN